MIQPAFRFLTVPLIGLAVTLAGCGSSASSPSSSPTAGATVSAAAAATPVVTGGQVAAIVNGTKVPMSTYRLLLNLTERQSATQSGAKPPSMKVIANQTMQSVVIDEIIRQYAVAHHITVSNGEVAQQELSDTGQLGGQKAFNARLAQLGLTPAQYKQLVIPSILGQKVEAQVAPLSKKPQPVADVRHILLSPHASGPKKRTLAQAHALAETLLAQLQHGANFAALAKKYSDDPGSANSGGEYKTVTPGEMVAPFDHAAFTQPLHQPEIIQTTYGYHIIEVLSRGTAPASATAQQTAQRSKFLSWISAQLKTAKVQRLAQVKGT